MQEMVIIHYSLKDWNDKKLRKEENDNCNLTGGKKNSGQLAVDIFLAFVHYHTTNDVILGNKPIYLLRICTELYAKQYFSLLVMSIGFVNQ